MKEINLHKIMQPSFRQGGIAGIRNTGMCKANTQFIQHHQTAEPHPFGHVKYGQPQCLFYQAGKNNMTTNAYTS